MKVDIYFLLEGIFFKQRNILSFTSRKKRSGYPGSRILLTIVFVIITYLPGCEKDNGNIQEDDNPIVEEIDEGSWVTYSPYKWPHDGIPYEGEYCKIYSDGVNFESRIELAGFADRKFVEILETFNFTATNDFLYPPKKNKIEPVIAAAFWGSVLLTVMSTEPDSNRCEYVLKHELTHAFEYLIEGTPELGTDVWFREGIAVFVGSNGGRNYFRTVDDLNSWIEKNEPFENQGNPITIHQWEDYPEGADIPGYYMVFDLVMKYLLDENGMGKSYQDVLSLFYDVRNGSQFKDAFQNNVGISLSDFENEIMERLRQYLS
jgi:hypothetical protein